MRSSLQTRMAVVTSASIVAFLLSASLRAGALTLRQVAAGDCNGDGDLTMADATRVLDWNFSSGEAPACQATCDANGDGEIAGSASDGIYILNHLFLGGPAPVALAVSLSLGCESPLDEPVSFSPWGLVEGSVAPVPLATHWNVSVSFDATSTLLRLASDLYAAEHPGESIFDEDVSLETNGSLSPSSVIGHVNVDLDFTLREYDPPHSVLWSSDHVGLVEANLDFPSSAQTQPPPPSQYTREVSQTFPDGYYVCVNFFGFGNCDASCSFSPPPPCPSEYFECKFSYSYTSESVIGGVKCSFYEAGANGPCAVEDPVEDYRPTDLYIVRLLSCSRDSGADWSSCTKSATRQCRLLSSE